MASRAAPSPTMSAVAPDAMRTKRSRSSSVISRQDRSDVAERLGVELGASEHLREPHREVRHVRLDRASEARPEQGVGSHALVHRAGEPEEHLDAPCRVVDGPRAPDPGRLVVLHLLQVFDEGPHVREERREHLALAEALKVTFARVPDDPQNVPAGLVPRAREIEGEAVG